LRGYIVDTRFPGENLVQVYRNNVFLSLTGALQAVYPVVQALVGERFFTRLSRDYITQYPSRSGNLHDFGRELPKFLSAYEPVSQLIYLPHVARLEWAYHNIFHAADAAGEVIDKLHTIPPEHHGDLCFTFHPATRLLVSPYPVLRIWEVNQEGFAGEQSVDLAEGGDALLVFRPELDVLIERLSDAEYEFLSALAARESLEKAVTQALRSEANFNLDACLLKHVQRKTLVDAYLPSHGGDERQY
jgi:hypothetical protein